MNPSAERPPLATEARATLDLLVSLGVPPLETLPVEAARQLQFPKVPGPEMSAVEDREVAGPHGPIPVRIYRPRAFDGPAPVLVYLHGGGWVVGTLDGYDLVCRQLAVAGDCVVVSVDYRLAPEHVYPAAIEDCLAAWHHLHSHALAAGFDPGRFAVAGDSAGGNLAAALCLRLRNAARPLPCYQVLYYPVTDAPGRWPSYTENGQGYLLTRAAMEWFWNHYAGHLDAPWPEDLAPLQAASHAGLPPALVVTAGYDPLCDEGTAYAARLRAAGVPTALREYPGQIHGFLGLGADGADCIAATGEELRRAFDFAG
jgi:acetyl esterase